MPRPNSLIRVLLLLSPASFGYYTPVYTTLHQTATIASINAKADMQRSAFVREYLGCAYQSSVTRLQHSDTASFWREVRRTRFDSSELAPYLARIDSINAGVHSLAPEDTVETRSNCSHLIPKEGASGSNSLAAVAFLLVMVTTAVVLMTVR